MTQSQAEILDKFDKTIDAVGIANHLASAKLIKSEGKPLIRMIIFYIILPLLNCGKLSPACKAAHMSLSAMCRMLNNKPYGICRRVYFGTNCSHWCRISCFSHS